MMFKKYISREPDVEVNVAPTNMKDDATVAVASVIHQDVNPEMGRIPDPEGYRQREGTQDLATESYCETYLMLFLF